MAEKLTKAMVDRDGGIDFNVEKITFGEYLERWLSDSVRGSVKERTLMSYEQMVRNHLIPALGHAQLRKLTAAHLQALYRQKLENGFSTRTVLGIHGTASGALKQATRWGLIRANPASATQPPSSKRSEVKALTPHQIKTLLEAARGTRLYALYALALATGLRHGELLGLRWEDVERKGTGGQLMVRRALVQSRPKGSGGEGYTFGTPKTGRARVVSFGSRVAGILREHRKRQAGEKLAYGPNYQDSGLVFTDEGGGKLSPWKSGRIYNQLAKRAGLSGFRFHDLRHTAATLALQEGIHPRVVQEMLGHARISQTLDTYSHVLPNMQAEAAEKLDSALS